MPVYVLPDLTYDYSALEPHISGRIMELHHDKHHGAYVKKANLGKTPGLADFVNEFVSDAATGKGGYLQSRGLIPLPAGQHNAQR